jgi:hypothetical protein
MDSRRLLIAFCLTAILLGGRQAWNARHAMNPDGIQYLDNADAYWNGDVRPAINAQWSPLYPWIIGAAFRVVAVSRREQFAVVHAVNFGVYLLSLAAFLFYVRCSGANRLSRPAQSAFLLLSCSAFLYCSLDLTTLSLVTPDLLVNTFAFLTAGFLLRAMRGGSAADSIWLGVSIGCGYLTKTPFFFYALACIAILWIGRHRRVWITVLVFAAIAGPYVFALSSAKQRWTLGDSGRLNVVWMVNGVPYAHWQGEPPQNGRPVHPTRQLNASPDVFEFASPIHATYPPWYDPSYWNEGSRIVWRASDFAGAVVRETRLYGYLIFHRQIPLLFAVAVLVLAAPKLRTTAENMLVQWPIMLFASLPFVLYAFVHAEGRYVAPFFVLLWSTLALGALMSMVEEKGTYLAVASVAAALMLTFAISAVWAGGPIQPAQQAKRTTLPSDDVQFQIAGRLNGLGMRAGDPVGIVSGELPYSWARLTGARITMEARLATAQDWEKARPIFEQHQAAFVVAPPIPGVVDQPGWLPLGETGAYAFRFVNRN